MPKYELMYILSSAVSDNDVPAITAEVDKFISDSGGKILTQEMLGKKKLAYPIKKTRNGFYVLESFNFEGPKIKSLDDKLRSLESIIRYMMVNVEDMEIRAEKDRKVQEKMKSSRKPQKTEEKSEEAAAPADIQLTETELEQKIEKALESGDLK